MSQNDQSTTSTTSAQTAAQTRETPRETTSAATTAATATANTAAESSRVEFNTLNTNTGSDIDTSEHSDKLRDEQQAAADNAQTNTGAEIQREEPKPQKRALSVEELQEKRRRGLLSVDEQKQLDEAEKNAEGKTGKVTQREDEDKEPKDPDKQSFKEGDVIDYMYNHWVIDGVMWCDQKSRKYIAYGYDRVRAATLAKKAQKQEDYKKTKESSSYKSFEKISEIRDKKEKEILKDYKETDKKIKNISKAIGNGTLFDEENKELLNGYKAMINADNSEEGAAKLEEVRQACEAYKNAPEDEKGSAEKETKKMAADFARDAEINARFDYSAQLMANSQTAATMVESIREDKNAFVKDGIEQAYEQTLNNKTADAIVAFSEDRDNALSSAKDLEKQNEAFMRSGANGAYAASIAKKDWERKAFGDIEKAEDLANKAFSFSSEEMEKGNFVEREKEPKNNKKLEELNKFIAGKMPEEEQQQQQQSEQEGHSEEQHQTEQEEKPEQQQQSEQEGHSEEQRQTEQEEKPEQQQQSEQEGHSEEQRQTEQEEKPEQQQQSEQEGHSEEQQQPERNTGHRFAREGVEDLKNSRQSQEHAPNAEPHKPIANEVRGGTLENAAENDKKNDRKNDEKRKNYADRNAELDSRAQEHEERGRNMQDRMARMKNRYNARHNKNSRSQSNDNSNQPKNIAELRQKKAIQDRIQKGY
ncbi:MAG: hypothetical protein MR368_01450 [Azospirillum sp.]|nr:hypothetical protein [Azospirillum sp.]